MPLWGWIPNLSEGRNPVPIPAEVLVLTDTDLGDDEAPVHVLADSVRADGCVITLEPLDGRQVRVSIDSGFFVISDEVESIQSIEGLDEFVYSELRRHYHLDVTHDEYGGLRFVEADSLEEAVKSTAMLFVSWAGSMNAERLYNIPPVSEYLVRQGFIKYGMSFVDTYSDELGRDASFFKEVLVSLDMFYGTSYDHYKNENMERLTAASTDLARRSTELAERSARTNDEVLLLSRLVFFLTISGIIVSIADLTLTHWNSDSLLFTTILVILLIATCWRLSRLMRPDKRSENDKNKDMVVESCDDAMDLRQLLCVVGCITSILVFAICVRVDVFSTMESIVLIAVSLVMFLTYSKK